MVDLLTTTMGLLKSTYIFEHRSFVILLHVRRKLIASIFRSHYGSRIPGFYQVLDRRIATTFPRCVSAARDTGISTFRKWFFGYYV
jgi:hypothetical protein